MKNRDFTKASEIYKEFDFKYNELKLQTEKIKQNNIQKSITSKRASISPEVIFDGLQKIDFKKESVSNLIKELDLVKL